MTDVPLEAIGGGAPPEGGAERERWELRRRELYVGMTRARDGLVGRGGVRATQPQRHLSGREYTMPVPGSTTWSGSCAWLIFDEPILNDFGISARR